jgi:outer membrane protein OmpA-like peptidoglycan-associated protein
MRLKHSFSTFQIGFWRQLVVAAGLLLLFNAAAPGQSGWTQGDERPDMIEISLFGGGSFFKSVSSGIGTEHVSGGAVGLRVTENFWKYISLEQGFTYSANNLRMPLSGAPQTVAFGNRVYQWNFNPVFHFTPRGSKVRPYLTAGVSAMNFNPTDTAEGRARLPENVARYNSGGLSDNLQAALNYGGGLKWHLTDHFGLRFDMRGTYSRNPTYGLLNTPNIPGGVYIPKGDKLWGFMPTVGLNWYLGKKYVPPPPAAPKPQALGDLTAGSLSAGTGTLCQGRPITIRSSGVSDPAGRQITYKWKVNGQPMGGDSPELQFTPERAGSYAIELEVSAPNTDGMPVRTAKANTLSINVQEYRAPTIAGVSAVPSQLNYGDTARLSATGTGSACSTISFKWTTSEGTIANDTSANASFDSKTVRFEQGGKIQAKTVTVRATVTDDRGATATGQAQMKIDYVPAAIRFSDLIFSKGSARVNNCAKRILLEEAAAKAADPDYEIVLVGHYDQDEMAKGNRPTTLDMQRVLNAYAVLTAGSGTCGGVDPSRIKVDWVGAEQSSDFQPGICGTSARPATGERRGSAVSTADQNRRVEVWLVPKGVKMPAAFKSAKTLDPKLIKKAGCPK